MPEVIDEQVSVNLLSNHLKGTVAPSSIFWRNRQYRIVKVGLHHIFREGRVLMHVFSVTDGNTFFKLLLNTDTLQWKLMEIAINE